MCYPKPGPRCSAHAAAAYAKAHQKVLNAFMNNAKDPELNRLVKLREKAEEDYRVTPAYIRELEKELAENPTDWRAERLADVKKKRAQLIALVTDERTVQHKTKPAQEYVSTQFASNGDEIISMPYNHPDLLASMEDSRKWSYQLDDEEISTLAWYSQAGYSIVNGHLNATVNPYEHKEVSKETIENSIQVLDSALNKHKSISSNGVIVYRRHHYYNEDGYHAVLPAEELPKMFPVGSVYEPNFYMSTSLDPGNLSTHSISLQILTKTGAPLTSISSQGPREYEFIIPRDTKFRVVSNNVKMKLKDHKGNVEEITVVQLEEI